MGSTIRIFKSGGILCSVCRNWDCRSAFVLNAFSCVGAVFLKKIVASKYSSEVAPIIFCGIAFAGTAAVGFGDGLMLTWYHWFLLGVGYILVADKNLLLN